MLLAYLLRIFMGSMIFLLLLEELFDSQKFVLIKLSLIIIDFLILCYAFLSILHTPWVSCYTSNILLMKKLKMLQNQLERIEYMLNAKIILCFLCPLKALNYIELNILNTHNLVYKMHNAHNVFYI